MRSLNLAYVFFQHYLSIYAKNPYTIKCHLLQSNPTKYIMSPVNYSQNEII